MTEFERLAEKGAQLVVARDKAAGHERYMLNKEIKAIRQAQLKALAEEIVDGLKPAIPVLVDKCLKESGVQKAIEELKRDE